MRRALRWGIVMSLLLHLGLLAFMLLANYRTWLHQRPLRVIQVTAAAPTEDDGKQPTVEQPATVAVTVGEVTGALVNQKLESSVEDASRRTVAENLERLNRLTGQLDRSSSDDSLDELATRLQGWLGPEARAERPAKINDTSEVAEFDVETAQLHDVTRRASKNGVFEYECILLDAQGQTRNVPLSPSEGKTLYDLMQKIKANPLLEKVYRSVAMPLLDRFIKSSQVPADLAPRPAEQPLAVEPKEEEPSETRDGR